MTKKLQDKINAAVTLTEDKLPGEVQDLGPESDIGKAAASKQKKASFPTGEAGDTTSEKLPGEVQDLGSENAGKNAASKESKAGLPDANGAGKAKDYVDVSNTLKESIEAVINEELEVSPEAKAKIVGMFEAAVIARSNELVLQEKEKLEEQYGQDLELAITDMTEKVDAYLTLSVNTWKNDNEIAIHQGIRTEIAESLMTKVLGVFLEHNVTVPEGADDLVEELNQKVDDLNEMYNATTKTAIALQKENTELKRVAAFASITEGLADTQKDKLATLVEGIEFEDAKSYTSRITSIKDSYFGNGNKSNTALTEDRKIVGTQFTEDTKVNYADPVKQAAAALKNRYKSK